MSDSSGIHIRKKYLLLLDRLWATVQEVHE